MQCYSSERGSLSQITQCFPLFSGFESLIKAISYAYHFEYRAWLEGPTRESARATKRTRIISELPLRALPGSAKVPTTDHAQKSHTYNLQWYHQRRKWILMNIRHILSGTQSAKTSTQRAKWAIAITDLIYKQHLTYSVYIQGFTVAGGSIVGLSATKFAANTPLLELFMEKVIECYIHEFILMYDIYFQGKFNLY